jgi:kynurenine formamidase
MVGKSTNYIVATHATSIRKKREKINNYHGCTDVVQVIDLTREISSTSRVFPGYPRPTFIKWSKFEVHGYDSEVLFLSTHTETHIDSPSHFSPGGKSIDQINAVRFYCKDALLLRVAKGSNESINHQDIIDAGLNLKPNDTLVIDTGWQSRYMKGKEQENDHVMSNPGLGEDATQFLVDRRVNAVAIDTPSIDTGNNSRLTSHKQLLSNDILVIENLCNLERIETGVSFTFVFSPLKLRGATGSPLRAIAILE